MTEVATLPINSEFLALAVAVGSLCVSGIAIVTFWMKLGTRIDVANSKAEVAKTSAADAMARASATEKELVDHRVKIAEEYVSKETLNNFRNELLGAINRLSDQVMSFVKAPH